MIVARSRARVGVLVLAGGVCVWMYQGLFRVVCWCGYIYVSIYALVVVACVVAVWWWSARVYR